MVAIFPWAVSRNLSGFRPKRSAFSASRPFVMSLGRSAFRSNLTGNVGAKRQIHLPVCTRNQPFRVSRKSMNFLRSVPVFMYTEAQ